LADASEIVHGTCVALGRTAALLRGPSGSGKSDLALRFLFLARRGPAALEAPILVADDQVCLTRKGTSLAARAPESIRGKIEVRGIGIVEVKSTEDTELALVVDLVSGGEIERLPDDAAMARLMGLDLPLLQLSPWEASAPIKLAVALAKAKRARAAYQIE
jgi:HPr kinase/phosphorylase